MIPLLALATLPACGDEAGGDHNDGDHEHGGNADPKVVKTTAGTVQGSASDTMRSWKGIPYAAPPVGPLRWKPPAAVAKFDGMRDATQLAKHCPQSQSPFGNAMNTAEDCLYLNVYAPVAAGPHPVMFWIHGGAFMYGQSDEYDVTRLVKEGVVVVTINYRLGALGFLAHTALTTEGGGSSGNYGLMDQQFALHWVQENIAAFGGDPKNVTIFGESAGGFSVESQLVSSGAAGLFHKAIVQSGAYANIAGRQMTLAQSEANGTLVLTAAGCADPCSLDAMRALSVDALVNAPRMVPAVAQGWIPTVDGKLITTAVGAAFTAGSQVKVPIIQGSNHDEYRLFVGLNEMAGAGPLTADTFLPAMKMTFGDTAGGQLAALYAPSAYNNVAGLAMAAAGTDAVFACPMLRAAQALAGAGTVYSYEFADPKAPQLFIPAVPDFEYGAAHASELQYLFKLTSPLPNTTLSAEQETLAEAMSKYWTQFAKTGDPNGGGLPMWPVYTKAANGIMSLVPGAGGITVTTNFTADHKCDIIAPAM